MGAWGACHRSGQGPVSGMTGVVSRKFGEGRVVGTVRSAGLGAEDTEWGGDFETASSPHHPTFRFDAAPRDRASRAAGGEVVGSHGGHRRCLVSLSCCHHECTTLRLAAAGDQAAVVSRSVGIASAVGHLVSQSFGQSVSQSLGRSSVVGRRSSVVGRSVVGQSVVGRSVGRWSVGHSVGRLVPRERRSRASASGVEASGVEASGERQARLIGTS